MEKKKYLWLGAAAVAGVALLGVVFWVSFGQRYLQRGGRESSRPEREVTTEVDRARVPTPVEATPEENKAVLDETKTSSGETFKAVSGQLISVEGRTLVLDAQGDRLQVEVAADAKITRTVLPDKVGEVPKVDEIALSQLQAGDKVDALVKVEGDKATATNVNVIVGPQ